MELRRYQKQLTNKIHKAFDTYNKICFQLPTGGGKTIIFTHIAKKYHDNNHHVLILAHREELVFQACEKLRVVIPDVEIGVIKAGEKPNYSAPIQVASVQTLTRRLDNFEPNFFNLIIVDEAHHGIASGYLRVLEHFTDAQVLGVTATPSRLDGKGLKKVFEHLVSADDEGVSVSFLMRNKYLSSYRAYAAPTQMNIAGVKTVAGDYDVKQIVEQNNAVVLSGNLIKSYEKYGKGGKCIVFAVNCDHSKTIVEEYIKAGYSAAHLDGKTPKEERREVLDKFRNGEIQILSNVGLFDEGFDLPSAKVVQIARPTKSLTKHLQIIGRVLRRDGNSVAIIIDHTNNLETLGLPVRKRKWTLDGVDKKKNDMYKTVKREDGSLVEKLNIEHEEVKLRRIVQERLTKSKLYEKQMSALTSYVQQMKSNSYKKGWLYYRIKELNPILDVWYEAAEVLDYSPKWGEYKFLEVNGVNVEMIDSRKTLKELLEVTNKKYLQKL